MKILVTGSQGFLGKNLVVKLKEVTTEKNNIEIAEITRKDTWDSIEEKVKNVAIVYHLAGINRPISENEYETGNIEFTTQLLEKIVQNGAKPRIIFSSSTQATAENSYGLSKLGAETEILKFAQIYGIETYIYRLPNVFGKWCKPNYNSAVATFCHNIARGLPIQINNSDASLSLIYVDDVLDEFLKYVDTTFQPANNFFPEASPVYITTVGEVADIIRSFKKNRELLLSPAVGNSFTKKLYTTYLTYLPQDELSYGLKVWEDNRGSLFELIKNQQFGQIFISTTKTGITRGNHYHHTKVEKFCVIKGCGLIRFKHILTGEITEYHVDGDMPKVVDIPAGYAHSIQNIGKIELVTLFWANEIFNPEKPDTYPFTV